MGTAAERARVLVVMGVSGIGKTTIGEQLAGALGWPFYDADFFHPEENVEKMSRGIPLGDADRAPWLEALHDLIARCLREGRSAVLACSALKTSYRRTLAQGLDGVTFVYLAASPVVIQKRLKNRTGHFMDPGLLESQFAALEEPEEALRVEAEGTPEEIVADILERLNSSRFKVQG